VQVGVLCPERSRFTHSGENVSGLAGEAIMLCMEPLCSYDAVSLFYLELYVKLSIYLSKAQGKKAIYP
jgi:hypothetical protein